MAYTVKELAKISGVTERTLRWYDKVNLLKPAYYGENGYRYYEEEQLLLLQQILYFRELDFSLDDIRGIITGNDFDKVKALNAHKKALKNSLDRTKTLIKTVDKTLLHLRGKIIMKDKDMYQGFQDWSKEKGAESFFIGVCDDPNALENEAEKLVLKNLRKHTNENRDKSYWEDLEKEYKKIYGNLARCVEDGLKPNDPRVQGLVREHHAFADRFHNCTREVYEALADLYIQKEEYLVQLRPFHSDLADFLSKAMKIFAQTNLK